MKLATITALLISSFAFAQAQEDSNMFVPLLNCKLSQESIAKIKESKSHSSAEFTLLADFRGIMTGSNARAIIVYSARQVGAVNEKSQALQEGVNAAELGTVSIDNKSGTLSYKSDKILYNHKYQWVHSFAPKVPMEDMLGNNATSASVTVLTHNVASGASEDQPLTETYDCRGVAID